MAQAKRMSQRLFYEAMQEVRDIESFFEQCSKSIDFLSAVGYTVFERCSGRR